MIAATKIEYAFCRPADAPDAGVVSAVLVFIVSRADVADFILKRIEANALNREKPVIIRFPL